jgi:predicted alpha/beta hydrolase family esterase
MRPIVFAIHGILTGQTSASWPDRFDAWCENVGVNAKVLKREYRAWPLPIFNVVLKNRWLARACLAELNTMAPSERPIHFVAHSNGTDIALKCVKRLAKRRIRTETLIVVGSVLQPDVFRNGVFDLVESRMLGSAVAYSSRNDGAIGAASHLPWCAYKDLGIKGWRGGGMVYQSSRIYTRRFDQFGHGCYFANGNREKTFELFCSDMGLMRGGG